MLSRAEARRVYDRVGAQQDAQAFYEDVALEALCAHSDFEEAHSVFELGCGTGRLAEHLLRTRLPPDARYVGVDLSATMVRLARERLAPFGDRAAIVHTDGTFAFERPADSQDRVVATYVLDLLSEDDLSALLSEAHRLLRPSGRLCLTGLTWGAAPMTRLVSAVWSGLHALWPAWVGGCRPMDHRRVLANGPWCLEHHEVVHAWGVPSEVVVAAPR